MIPSYVFNKYKAITMSLQEHFDDPKWAILTKKIMKAPS